MRSFPVSANETGYPSQYTNLLHDARGGSFLLAHQQLGALALPSTPTNGQTISLVVNGTTITLTAVTGTPTNPGDVKAPGTAAGFATNVVALLNQPQATTANGIALSGANQQLLSYLSFSLSGTTITISSANITIYAPLTSFTASTTVTGASWTAQTMQLYVEPGVIYVSGTRVVFAGGSTSTVTAPSANPRIDVLTIDNSGTLAWTTGTESATPSAPAYPANKVPLCELYNVVGEIALYDNDNQQSNQGYIYNDVRAFLQPSVNWGAFANDLIPDADGTRNLGSPSKEWNNIYAKSGIFLNGAPFGSQITYAATALESINAGAPVAIGLSQATDIGFDTNGKTTATGTITIGSNSNRVLAVVAIGHANSGSSPNISGSFNGSSLSFTNTAETDNGGNPFVIATAVLVAPNTGSGSFSLSITGVAAAIDAVFYFSLYNCAQSSPQDARTVAGGTSTGSSASLTLGTDGALTLGVLFTNTGTSSIGTVSGLAFNANTSTASNPAYAIGTSGVTTIYPANLPLSISNTGATSGMWFAAVLAIKPFNAVTEGLQNASSASVTIGNTRCTGFIGFAVSTVTQGQSLTVVTQGTATGLTGLILGTEYYLNDTNGTIGTSAGSNSRKVGVALSTTQLVITNIW